jgi:hypothetical protein
MVDAEIITRRLLVLNNALAQLANRLGAAIGELIAPKTSTLISMFSRA